MISLIMSDSQSELRVPTPGEPDPSHLILERLGMVYDSLCGQSETSAVVERVCIVSTLLDLKLLPEPPACPQVWRYILAADLNQAVSQRAHAYSYLPPLSSKPTKEELRKPAVHVQGNHQAFEVLAKVGVDLHRRELVSLKTAGVCVRNYFAYLGYAAEAVPSFEPALQQAARDNYYRWDAVAGNELRAVLDDAYVTLPDDWLPPELLFGHTRPRPLTTGDKVSLALARLGAPGGVPIIGLFATGQHREA